MKIALCKRRTLPPGRRQDGFIPLPPKAMYDLVVEARIRFNDTELAEYQGRFFVRSNEKYDGLPLFIEASHEKAENAVPMKHSFGPPETVHGQTCRICGIHSQSTEADKDCHGEN